MIGWLLAFLVHSSLWLGLAWLGTRLWPNMHPRLRETVWYTAIVASLIAPTAQTLDSRGAAAFWSLPLPATLVSAPDVEHQPLAASPEHAGEHAQAGGAAEHAPPSVTAVGSWQQAALWVWLSLAVVLVFRYFVQIGLIRRRLDPRDLIENSPERSVLSRLSGRAGLPRTPRITESENLGSPIALGFGARTEICVPTRSLHELDDEQFCAMLGHEVAHLMRSDPLRFGFLHVLRTVFFFQPLLRIAVREVQLAAEEQCDAWGANHAEGRTAMASCLTEVASWVLRDRLPVVAMARRRSHLGVRIDRLMDERRGFEAPGKLWRGVAAVALVGFAPWLTPTVRPATTLDAEFLTVELRAEALESEARSLLAALRESEEISKHREQAEQVRAEKEQLRRMRSLLSSVFGARSPEKRRRRGEHEIGECESEHGRRGDNERAPVRREEHRSSKRERGNERRCRDGRREHGEPRHDGQREGERGDTPRVPGRREVNTRNVDKARDLLRRVRQASDRLDRALRKLRLKTASR